MLKNWASTWKRHVGLLFMAYLTLLQSYKDDKRVIMKGFVQ